MLHYIHLWDFVNSQTKSGGCKDLVPVYLSFVCYTSNGQWTIFVLITNSTWKNIMTQYSQQITTVYPTVGHVDFLAKTSWPIRYGPPQKSLAGPFLWYLQIYYVHHNSRFKNSTIVTTQLCKFLRQWLHRTHNIWTPTFCLNIW